MVYCGFIVVYGLLLFICRFPQLGEVLPGGEGWFIEGLLMVYCCLFAGFHSWVWFYLERGMVY